MRTNLNYVSNIQYCTQFPISCGCGFEMLNKKLRNKNAEIAKLGLRRQTEALVHREAGVQIPLSAKLYKLSF